MPLLGAMMVGKIEPQGFDGGPGFLAGAFPRREIVDLSHTVSPGMPRWPGDPAVTFTPWADLAGDGYYLRRFSMGEHGGTHLAAPASYYPDGQTADGYSAAELVKPAVVIDVRAQCRANPDYGLTPADLLGWESRYGVVPSGVVVLLLTGWGERWDNPAAYLGMDAGGDLHFPGFGLEAAGLLLDGRGAAGLGTDTAGVEPGWDAGLTVSRLALSQPRIVLENLANLHRLPATGAVLVIGLLRLVGGSGGPAAVTAFLP